MRGAAIFFFLISIPGVFAGDFGVPKNCGQAVVVTAPAWSSPTAMLQRWERARHASAWQKVDEPVRVLIGERGLGWGLGLHRAPEDGARRKAEGDRRAPAGVFALTGAFGRSTAPVGRMSWQPITPTLEAIDDPASRFYNRIVDRATAGRVDWKSSERMSAIPDYALGIVVAHNPRHVAGAGSCIFIHLWLGKRPGTAGCTALRERDLAALVRWLDPARQPVLIQLPRAVALRELDGF